MKHPLAQFLYCPECGSPHFEVNNEKSKKCTDCGFVYYFNPSSATVALILNEKKELLVCRRAKEPAKGTLDLPGGFIDMNETGEEGVGREVWEETGLKVEKATYQFSLPNIYRQWMTWQILSSCHYQRYDRKISGWIPFGGDLYCFWLNTIN